MFRVALVNENTLGHRAYLPAYGQALAADATFGVEPILIDAVPLPKALRRFGDGSIRILRRWGWDFHATRWRLAASWNALRQLQVLHLQQPVDAVVVNTQSVGLELCRWKSAPPYYVCLDATFAQLARSPWLAPRRLGRWTSPITLAYLRARERELFRSARGFMPWSEVAAQSLRDEYGVSAEKIHLLPPSVPAGAYRKQPVPQPSRRRRILFMGGDFQRKGGPLLLDAYRRHLVQTFDLQIVTESPVKEEPGVQVLHGVQPNSAAWRACWESADVFVFPSTLETFGIVLVEALAFGVPVVSTRVGAADEILANGAAGLLLNQASADDLAMAIQHVFQEPESTARRVARGLQLVQAKYDRADNARRLATLLTRNVEAAAACG